MTGAEAARGAGQEVLILDQDQNVLRGLERLLLDAGLSVTALSDMERARDQLANRFIPVVLCDLDTPSSDAGLELVQFVRENSPLTTVIVMTARATFPVVAPLFRAGAGDVVPKTQDSVPYLRSRVLTAAADTRVNASREQLLREMGGVHEEFLHKMMELARQVTDLEDKLLSREDEGSVSVSGLGPVTLLLVDDDSALAAVLDRELSSAKGWRVRHVLSGGEALDASSHAKPQILVVKETLPDLPGKMVIGSIKGGSPDVVALMYTPPSDAPGEVRLLESSRLHTLITSFSRPEQLIGSLQEVREGLRQKARERRYLQLFRKQHYDFLKRYSQLKQRLEEQKALEDQSPSSSTPT